MFNQVGSNPIRAAKHKFLVCGCIRKQDVRLKSLSLEGNRKSHAISRTKWYLRSRRFYISPRWPKLQISAFFNAPVVECRHACPRSRYRERCGGSSPFWRTLYKTVCGGTGRRIGFKHQYRKV